MNFKSHFTFGIFTGLLTYYFTSSIIAALIVFIVQIILILDFLFKKLVRFEPLHTVLAMIAVWLLSFFVFPAYHWYVLVAYFMHLFLDIFVHEEIPLLYPLKKKLMFPIKHSERFVITMSLIGSLVLLLIEVLKI